MQDFVYQPNEPCWDIAFCSQGQGHRNDVQHEAEETADELPGGCIYNKKNDMKSELY